jgi:acyl-coenzyme A synthetase/AMP-(fatty) acid ligase/pimeloyl-ACP methyl ester carboxylesterase
VRAAPVGLPAGRLERLGIEPTWSRTVAVTFADGTELNVHALDASPPDDRRPPLTVVCVHGNPTWAILWRSFHRRLGDRYRVLAVDQVSMGLSERTGPRAFARRVDDLGRILDAFAVEGPVVLAAHDWGGPIGLGWALEHRESLRGILLANTGVAIPSTGVPPLIRLAGSRALRDIVCRRSSLFLRATLAAPGRPIARDVKRAYLAPYGTPEGRIAIEGFVADIPTTPVHPSAAAVADVVARLPELDVPVLLAWGERDPVFHLGFAADLRRRLPQAGLHRFPQAGHLVVEEEDVAALADAWIGSLLAPPRTAQAPAAVARAPALWDALVAREEDDATAIVVGRGPPVSFAALAGRVAEIAEGLREAGVAPGDRVALLTPDPPDFVASAYACWVIGAITVVVDRGLGLTGLRRALRGAEPRWALGTQKTLAVARMLRWAPSARRLELATLRNRGAKGGSRLSAVVDRLAPAADAAAAVVFTSGATGPAKGVLYDQRRMAAQFVAVRECYAITPGDRLVAAFAPFALYGPALGIPVAVPDCDITQPGSLRADRLADACAAVEATIVFAAPAALASVIASRDGLTADGRAALGLLRLVLSAGAPVPQRVLEAFGALAPHAELHTPYGMTEVLSVADVDLETLAGLGPGRGVCVGRPLAAVGVRIEPLTAGAASGEIVVSAPWQSSGYDGLWAATEHARSVDDDGVEWHRTGDVGHLDGGGRLWVEGRMAHVVQTVDGPVTPVPLEIAAESAIGCRCAVTGIGPKDGQQVVLIVERQGRAGLAAPAVDSAVRAALVPQAVAAVLTVPKLPVDRRHNSKIDRTRLGLWAEVVLSGRSAPRCP